MAAEDWDHGDPMWEAYYFTKTEIEAFNIFRSLTYALSYRRRTRIIRIERIISKAFTPLLLGVNPRGEAGEWKLLLREEQTTVATPERLGGKKPVRTRHMLSVALLAGGEEFLEANFVRPKMEHWEIEGTEIFVPDEPATLLQTDLSQELCEQAQYLSWLEAARTNRL